jgi:hypothetical protein
MLATCDGGLPGAGCIACWGKVGLCWLRLVMRMPANIGHTHSSEGEGMGPGVSSDLAPPAAAAGVLWPCPCCLPAGVLGGVDLAAVGVACWSGLLPAASEAAAVVSFASLPLPCCRTVMAVTITLGTPCSSFMT